jgi:hypothetical protein
MLVTFAVVGEYYMYMKSWTIAAGIFCTLSLTNILVSAFTTPVEYVYPEAVAYIEGATPLQIQHWEMY